MPKTHSSTRGKSIKHLNPLNKGGACSICRRRRVRCDGQKPHCGSCKKSAKWKKRPVEAWGCDYGEEQLEEIEEPKEEIEECEIVEEAKMIEVKVEKKKRSRKSHKVVLSTPPLPPLPLSKFSLPPLSPNPPPVILRPSSPPPPPPLPPPEVSPAVEVAPPSDSTNLILDYIFQPNLRPQAYSPEVDFGYFPQTGGYGSELDSLDSLSSGSTSATSLRGSISSCSPVMDTPGSVGDSFLLLQSASPSPRSLLDSDAMEGRDEERTVWDRDYEPYRTTSGAFSEGWYGRYGEKTKCVGGEAEGVRGSLGLEMDFV